MKQETTLGSCHGEWCHPVTQWKETNWAFSRKEYMLASAWIQDFSVILEEMIQRK